MIVVISPNPKPQAQGEAYDRRACISSRSRTAEPAASDSQEPLVGVLVWSGRIQGLGFRV